MLKFCVSCPLISNTNSSNEINHFLEESHSCCDCVQVLQALDSGSGSGIQLQLAGSSLPISTGGTIQIAGLDNSSGLIQLQQTPAGFSLCIDPKLLTSSSADTPVAFATADDPTAVAVSSFLSTAAIQTSNSALVNSVSTLVDTSRLFEHFTGTDSAVAGSATQPSVNSDVIQIFSNTPADEAQQGESAVTTCRVQLSGGGVGEVQLTDSGTDVDVLDELEQAGVATTCWSYNDNPIMQQAASDDVGVESTSNGLNKSAANSERSHICSVRFRVCCVDDIVFRQNAFSRFALM